MTADNAFSIIRYASYEELEAAFRLRTGHVAFRQFGGIRSFWEDFREFYGSGWAGIEKENGERRPGWITANPRDCLAFGTTEQVLRAAALAGGVDFSAVESVVADLTGRYDLAGQRHQSLRTLSGGEIVRLALAKMDGLSPGLSRLTIASPFSWLSTEGRRHFRNLLDRLSRHGVAVELLSLEGEGSMESAPPSAAWSSGPAFPLVFSGVRFSLGTPLERLFGRTGEAVIAEAALSLRSPCLLMGGNGEGKSLVAKVLSGAVGREGTVRVGIGAPARLLFQDAFNQTLMRPPHRLLPRADQPRRHRALDLYGEIRSFLPAADLRRTPSDPGLMSRGNGTGEPTGVLVVKMLLAAVRLMDPGGAILLDEPDWGLNREAAVGFVDGVVAAAHRRRIPVILISHQPWWLKTPGSKIAVRKKTTDSATGCPGLRLELRMVEEG
ncbi:MAG: hypothetical protein ACOWWM_07195 [Desulfobacterales bacterium]